MTGQFRYSLAALLGLVTFCAFCIWVISWSGKDAATILTTMVVVAALFGLPALAITVLPAGVKPFVGRLCIVVYVLSLFGIAIVPPVGFVGLWLSFSSLVGLSLSWPPQGLAPSRQGDEARNTEKRPAH